MTTVLHIYFTKKIIFDLKKHLSMFASCFEIYRIVFFLMRKKSHFTKKNGTVLQISFKREFFFTKLSFGSYFMFSLYFQN